MSTPIKIRAYQPTDKNALIQLWTDCGLVVPHNDPSKDIERKLRVNPEWLLIGERDGKVVASCMVGYEGHRGWINYLAVSPSCQKRGYALSMMKRAEQLLADAGCPKVNLQIRASNSKVIAFYERIGFTADAVVSLGKRIESDLPR